MRDLLRLLSNSNQSQTSRSASSVTAPILIALSIRVTGLSNVLRDIESVLSQQALTNWQKKALVSLLEECHNVLTALGKVVDENYCLKQSNANSFHNKSQRVWKRLKWEPDDIQELRSRVIFNVALLNAFNGSLIRCFCKSPDFILLAN